MSREISADDVIAELKLQLAEDQFMLAVQRAQIKSLMKELEEAQRTSAYPAEPK